MHISIFAASGLTLCLAGSLVAAPGGELGADALIDIPLEELMQMDATVSSVSKRDETLADIPAAIFVITQEDIRRSAVTSVADALRMAPGLQVAKISASEWAVSARGLGGRFSRYLLVLIDGRSLYSSLFSGVNWDEINLSLENIERIEVVRGPGGTIWGANAVNGMVNIITRKPSQRAHTRVRVSGGQGESLASVFAATNQPLGDNAAMALSGHVEQLSALAQASSPFEDRDWRNGRLDVTLEARVGAHEIGASLGFSDIRTDVPWSKHQAYPTREAVVYGDEHKTGQFAVLHWQLPGANGQWSGRLSYDDIARAAAAYTWNSLNWEAELQWAGQWLMAHRATLGVSARYSESHFITPPEGMDAQLSPASQDSSIHSVYLQDTWALSPDWQLHAGLRYDDNSFTKSAWQPSLRSLWSIDDLHSTWLAVSRANSTPSRVLNSQSELIIQALPPTAENPLPSLAILSSDGRGVRDVELTAYEWGYRYLPVDRLTLDLSLFQHDYRHVMAADANFIPELRFQDGLPYVALPVTLNTDAEQQSRGIEVSLRYQPLTHWHLQYSGAYLTSRVSERDSAVGSLLEDVIEVPAQQHSLRSLWNISQSFELDAWLRRAPATRGNRSESYTALDINFNYRASQRLHVSLGLRNVFADETVEFTREIFSVGSYAVNQSILLKFEWQTP